MIVSQLQVLACSDMLNKDLSERKNNLYYLNLIFQRFKAQTILHLRDIHRECTYNVLLTKLIESPTRTHNIIVLSIIRRCPWYDSERVCECCNGMVCWYHESYFFLKVPGSLYCYWIFLLESQLSYDDLQDTTDGIAYKEKT